MRIRIIAEIGENHLGDMERARTMVRLAAGAGADYVKFQSYDEADLGPGVDEGARGWIRRVQLTEADHRVLKAEAERWGAAFLSTAVNVRWARFLKDLGCETVKLASLSLTNEPLLRYAGTNFREVFLSTGMGEPDEVDRALKILGEDAAVTVLHCVSEYPTPDARANLQGIRYLQDRFGRPTGYSDHTLGTVACVAAMGMGAKVVEKHFTLDKTLEGTDHVLSADPVELAEIVQAARRVEVMLGASEKRPTEKEIAQRAGMRALFRP